jgi:hypothetical protein
MFITSNNTNTTLKMFKHTATAGFSIQQSQPCLPLSGVSKATTKILS